MNPRKRKVTKTPLSEASLCSEKARDRRVTHKQVEKNLCSTGNKKFELKTNVNVDYESLNDNNEYSESNLKPQASKKGKNDAINNPKKFMDNVTDNSISSEEDSVLNKQIYDQPILPNYNEGEKNTMEQNKNITGQKHMPMNLQLIEPMLENSAIIKQILQCQLQISNTLNELVNQKAEQSVFSVDKNLTVVELTADQRSAISHCMRNKF